jgi:hypothetical protein
MEESRGEGLPAMTVMGARSLAVGPPIRVSVILPAGAVGVQAMGSVSPMLYFAWFGGLVRASKPDVCASATDAKARTSNKDARILNNNFQALKR